MKLRTTFWFERECEWSQWSVMGWTKDSTGNWWKLITAQSELITLIQLAFQVNMFNILEPPTSCQGTTELFHVTLRFVLITCWTWQSGVRPCQMSECHQDINEFIITVIKLEFRLNLGLRTQTGIQPTFDILDEAAAELWYLINCLNGLSSWPSWSYNRLTHGHSLWVTSMDSLHLPSLHRQISVDFLACRTASALHSWSSKFQTHGGTKQLTGKTSKRFFEGWASGVTTLQYPVLDLVSQTAHGCCSIAYKETVLFAGHISHLASMRALMHGLMLWTFPVFLTSCSAT